MKKAGGWVLARTVAGKRGQAATTRLPGAQLQPTSMNMRPRKHSRDGGGSHRRSRAASTQGLDGRRDGNVSDARPKRARLRAGEVHIAQFPHVAVREAIDVTNTSMQRRGVLDVVPRWRGCRYTLDTAAARRHKALDSGPEHDIEEPMPNANPPESAPERQPQHRG